MDITTLTPKMQELIRDKVERGQFADATGVIEEALQLLADRDSFRELRASIKRAREQVARGEYYEWTPEYSKRVAEEAHQLVLQGKTPKPDVCP